MSSSLEHKIYLELSKINNKQTDIFKKLETVENCKTPKATNSISKKIDYIKDLVSEDIERHKNSEKLQIKKEVEDIKTQVDKIHKKINLVENSLQEIKEVALELKKLILG